MKYLTTLATALLLTGACFAEADVLISGQIQHAVPMNTQQAKTRGLFNAPHSLKTITLMDIQLSDHAWSQLDNRLLDVQSAETHYSNRPDVNASVDGPLSKQLGMAGVPVFDQGKHGSCATFANTAAVEAALNWGDYISQLCHLQLGSRLETYGYNPSGWNGSLGPNILNQMQSFGVVSKFKQRFYGCGQTYEYPLDDTMPYQDISLNEFHELSEPLPEDKFAWSSILDVYSAFLDQTNSESILAQVKESINKRDRMSFGVLLFGLNQGVAGATGHYKYDNDTWILTPKIMDSIRKKKNYGGHEMIVTGYDDYARAIDEDGNTHTGLLTLRNSWGKEVGDQGNFYMSYDYFKLLVIEIQRIRAL